MKSNSCNKCIRVTSIYEVHVSGRCSNFRKQGQGDPPLTFGLLLKLDSKNHKWFWGFFHVNIFFYLSHNICIKITIWLLQYWSVYCKGGHIWAVYVIYDRDVYVLNVSVYDRTFLSSYRPRNPLFHGYSDHSMLIILQVHVSCGFLLQLYIRILW